MKLGGCRGGAMSLGVCPTCGSCRFAPVARVRSCANAARPNGTKHYKQTAMHLQKKVEPSSLAVNARAVELLPATSSGGSASR